MRKAKKIKVLGVCGGNGVILHPLKRYVVGNIEDRNVFKTQSNLQWYINFKVPFVDDLMVAKFLFKRPHVIIGAPDCGHSSILGNTGHSKKNGQPRKTAQENPSINMFFQAILDYKPKIWVMENLNALLNQIPMSTLKDKFPDYRFIFHTVSMAELGNSQKTRKRLIVIGLDRSLPSQVFMEFSEITRTHPPSKVKDILKGLEKDDYSIGNVREDPDKEIKMGKLKLTFDEIRKGWKTLYKGKKYWPLKKDKPDGAVIPGVYRLSKDQYPQTCRQDPRQFRPDGLPLSPRELARIQGVPDSFKLLFPDPSEYRKPKEDKHYFLNKARITVAKGAPYELGEWVARKLKICKEHII